MVSRALRVSNTSPPNHFTLQTSTSMLLQYEQTCSTTSEERSEQSEQRSERRTAEQRWRLLDDLWLISCVLWISDYVALWLVLICCCVSVNVPPPYWPSVQTPDTLTLIHPIRTLVPLICCQSTLRSLEQVDLSTTWQLQLYSVNQFTDQEFDTHMWRLFIDWTISYS